MKIYVVSLIGMTLGVLAFFLPLLIPLYVGISVAFIGYGIVLLHKLLANN
ncbi:hypothetical protein [Bacillus sp. PS06]|nr:hypothetical protein [Bacillus sp. PS06]MBD8068595.1 hypothetical protein [Bacillus sp. PS06]